MKERERENNLYIFLYLYTYLFLDLFRSILLQIYSLFVSFNVTYKNCNLYLTAIISQSSTLLSLYKIERNAEIRIIKFMQ